MNKVNKNNCLVWECKCADRTICEGCVVRRKVNMKHVSKGEAESYVKQALLTPDYFIADILLSAFDNLSDWCSGITTPKPCPGVGVPTELYVSRCLLDGLAIYFCCDYTADSNPCNVLTIDRFRTGLAWYYAENTILDYHEVTVEPEEASKILQVALFGEVIYE